jgi:hypothetical protein
MMLFGRVLVVFFTKDLVTLCSKVSVSYERVDWFEEQSNKCCKKDEKSEQRCMIDDNIDVWDCERLRDDFTALRTEYQEHDYHRH